jgi:hypothetical protein
LGGGLGWSITELKFDESGVRSFLLDSGEEIFLVKSGPNKDVPTIMIRD